MASSHDIVSNPFACRIISVKASLLCRRKDFSISDYDDLCQNMRVHLLEKAHLFDPSRATLEAFITTVVCSWVQMHLRYRSRMRRAAGLGAKSLERTMVEQEGEEDAELTTLGNMLLEEDGQRLTRTFPATEIDMVDARDGVEHLLKHLSPDDQALLLSVVEKGVRPTARDLGISWRQVTNRMAKIRRQAKKLGLGNE